ncbi:MAG: efflux RND transporter periplasmic adaptor subunit [Hyphomicrobiaceae bacterium]
MPDTAAPTCRKNLRAILPAGAALVLWLVSAMAPGGPGMAAERVIQKEFDCVIDPARVVKLGSPVTGILAEVLVNRGDIVKSGEIVARMDMDVEQVSVEVDRLRAESTAEIDAQVTRNDLLRKELDRATALMKTGSSTQQRVDDLTAQLRVGLQEVERLEIQKKMAALALKRSETQLGQRLLRSPVDGIVQQRVLTGGEFVNQQSHILVIAQLDPLLVETFLPVAHYKSIRPGQAATVTLQGAVDGEFKAVVTVVDRIFDAASKTFGVRLELRNKNYALPAGQVCKVAF